MFAVIAVIIGTFFLFGSISVIILKALKKNKNIYYKEKNMTFISGLLFRVKESSAALASICIISTMFLVVFTCLTGLLKSRDTFLDYAFPSDYSIMYYGWDKELNNTIEEKLEEISKKKDAAIKEIIPVERIIFETSHKNDEFTPNVYKEGEDRAFDENMEIVSLVNLEEFNKVSDKKYELNDKEALMYSNKGSNFANFKIGDLKFKVKNLEEIPNYYNDPAQGLFHNIVLVVKDSKVVTDEIDKFIGDIKDGGTYTHGTQIYINMVDNKNVPESFFNEVEESIFTSGLISQKYQSTLTNGIDSRIEFNNLYSGIYIVSTLLSVIFLITTSIIIYYKQISEGISDGKNIAIMKKIGMSDRQIRKQVARQNSFMFFAPLVVAFCHTLGSSKIVFDIVKIVGVIEKSVFMKSTLLGMGMYFVVYFIMFKLSTGVYLKMAKRYENR